MTERRITLADIGIAVGILLVAASVAALAYSGIKKQASPQNVKQVVAELHTLMPETHNTVPDDRVNMTMPAMEVDGESFCGIVEIPKYDTELPLFEAWKKNRTDSYLCKYMGSLYDGSLIIGAGDNAELFGFAKRIQNDDTVIITDMTGGRYTYTVTDIRRSKDLSTEYLTSLDADLVLFVKNSYSTDNTVILCKSK